MQHVNELAIIMASLCLFCDHATVRAMCFCLQCLSVHGFVIVLQLVWVFTICFFHAKLSHLWEGFRNKVDFCDDIREQYKEMRDEFMAGLEDRKYLTIEQVRNKAFEVTVALQTAESEQTVSLTSCCKGCYGLTLLSPDSMACHHLMYTAIKPVDQSCYSQMQQHAAECFNLSASACNAVSCTVSQGNDRPCTRQAAYILPA